MKRTISEVLQKRISDPRIEGFVSITRVKVSPDLHDAYVYVSIMPENKQKQVVGGLKHAAGHIRKLVGKSMATKTMPHLEFRLDDTLKTQSEIYGAIRRGMDRSGPAPPEDEQGEPGEQGGQEGQASAEPSSEPSSDAPVPPEDASPGTETEQ